MKHPCSGMGASSLSFDIFVLTFLRSILLRAIIQHGTVFLIHVQQDIIPIREQVVVHNVLKANIRHQVDGDHVQIVVQDHMQMEEETQNVHHVQLDHFLIKQQIVDVQHVKMDIINQVRAKPNVWNAKVEQLH